MKGGEGMWFLLILIPIIVGLVVLRRKKSTKVDYSGYQHSSSDYSGDETITRWEEREFRGKFTGFGSHEFL